MHLRHAPDRRVGGEERPPVRRERERPAAELRDRALLRARRHVDAEREPLDDVERVHERGVPLRVDVERQQPAAVRRGDRAGCDALHQHRLALGRERAREQRAGSEVVAAHRVARRRRSSAGGRGTRPRRKSSRRGRRRSASADALSRRSRCREPAPRWCRARERPSVLSPRPPPATSCRSGRTTSSGGR